MKTFVLFIFLAFMCSCITQEEQKALTPAVRFKVGDTAYLKPDSLKCIIYYFGGNHPNPSYAIRYTDNNGVIRTSGTGWGDPLIRENMFH